MCSNKMVFYDYESDSGDISLSTSVSSPQLSSILRDTSLDAGPSQFRRAPVASDATSPTPQMLYGKSLWKAQGDNIPELSLNIDEDPITPTSSTFTNHKIGTTTPTRPTQTNRRTSSNSTLTRSKSLNVNVRLSNMDETTPVRTPSMRLGWTRRPGEPRPPPLVGEGVSRGVGRWLKEIVVCNFDLERGPVVERRVLGRRWGRGEKENV
jgi:hypothetical protein